MKIHANNYPKIGDKFTYNDGESATIFGIREIKNIDENMVTWESIDGRSMGSFPTRNYISDLNNKIYKRIK